MTFSIERICENCKKKSDWTDSTSEFITRILFYNNGQKTISKNELFKLELISTGKIYLVKIIKGSETIRLKSLNNKVYIEFDYIDSSDFFVLEIYHNGKLEVNGRVNETGKLLNSAPKYWRTFYLFFIVSLFAMTYYNFKFLLEKNETDILKVSANIFIPTLPYYIFRYIHSVFFIPDSITSRYLKKNKSPNKFMHI